MSRSIGRIVYSASDPNPPMPASRVLRSLVLLSLFLASCGGNSVDQNKFERLKVGMTSQDVEAILGDGKPIPADEVAMRASAQSQGWQRAEAGTA